MSNLMPNDVSIEYAHIYTNNHIGDEQKFSLDILKNIQKEYEGKKISLVVMVDDYSFPDPSFDYGSFSVWLGEQGFPPNFILRESQLIPSCDELLKLVRDEKLREQITDYVKAKKYPCSLFVATWYLLRLGYLKDQIFGSEFVAGKIVNILPESFKPFEDKAFEIMRATEFGDAVVRIENNYFAGRLVA
jgi:hypothetical protein